MFWREFVKSKSPFSTQSYTIEEGRAKATEDATFVTSENAIDSDGEVSCVCVV